KFFASFFQKRRFCSLAGLSAHPGVVGRQIAMDFPMTADFKAAALEAEAGSSLILALPKGRILSECAPLLAGAGIVPHADYADEDSRALRFPTDDPGLDV